MRQDFSWKTSKQQYEALYRRLIGADGSDKPEETKETEED
jgi:hypothetical protein